MFAFKIVLFISLALMMTETAGAGGAWFSVGWSCQDCYTRRFTMVLLGGEVTNVLLPCTAPNSYCVLAPGNVMGFCTPTPTANCSAPAVA